MMTKIDSKSGKGITGKQLKLLWMLARQLGMDNDSLHALVFKLAGKDSIKTLSISEAAKIIDNLIETGAKVKRKRKSRRDLPANVVELVTVEQKRFIKYLEKQLGWQNDPERLKGFLRKIIKREGVRTKQEGIKIIQGLKSMTNRKIKPGKEVNSVKRQ